MPTGQQEVRQQEIEIHFEPEQLVVDLGALKLVQAKLDSIPVRWNGVERNSRLGLALFKLDNVSGVNAIQTEPAGGSDLDRLIRYLQNSFKDDYGGWMPVMGKNRLVGSVEGSPYTGGGQGLPQPYTGGGQGGPQQIPLSGWLPRRADSPIHRVRVGILDTRLFPHPDLAGRYLAGQDTIVPQPADAPADEAHATFIAGIVLRWAPNADLIVDHVLNDNAINGSSWDVATKMVAFLDADVDVLNISFGTATDDNQPPLVLSRAIEVLTPTITVIAAAGNHGQDKNPRPIWPAAFGSVTSVGAATRVGGTDSFKPATFSPDLPWVSLVAPGEKIVSTYETRGYREWSGTSFAAARVSGAIAHLVETEHMTPKAAVDALLVRPLARSRTASGNTIEDIGPR
jgi:hypothetical protein